MRNLSTELKTQLYGQTSNDPFLMLITLESDVFSTIRLVNDIDDAVSRGNTFTAFPMKIILPTDDGETVSEVAITFDNVSLELIDEIRTAIDPIDVTIEMVLFSDLETVQIEIAELKIRDITYSSQSIQAKLYLDDFLNTEMTSEKYTPSLYPGIY